MPEPVLVIACGALATELAALKQANAWAHMHIQCLHANLHNHPTLIPALLQEKIQQAKEHYQHIFIAYADCGTAGGIDRIIEQEKNIERLPGAHCYQFFAGAQRFEQLAEEEPGSFYLTDFLVRFFDRLVIKALKLEQHPQLRGELFAHYKRVVYLSQTHNSQLLAAAKQAAKYLHLDFQHIHSGYGEMETQLIAQLRA